jgi:hypothetical protein
LEATLAERLLDGVVKVVALELRDPPGAIAPDTRQPQDIPFAQSGADEHGDEPHEGQVLLSYELVGRRAREPERDVDAFEGHERDVELVTLLSKGLVRTRRTSPSDLDIPEGQIPGRECIRDGVRVDAHRIETQDESGSKHVSSRIGPVVFRLEDAHLGEQRDVF